MFSVVFKSKFTVVTLGLAAVIAGALFLAQGAHITIMTADEYAPAGIVNPDLATLAAASITPMYLVPMTPVDKVAYDAQLLSLANLSPKELKAYYATATSTATTTLQKPLWPVTTAPYPLPGALLPSHRIVAYYGNLATTELGVLGRYPVPQMLDMLASTTAQWAAADPSTPVIPAFDYIVVTAQGQPGADGKYRLRMPDSEIDKVLRLAGQAHAIVILDIQVGLSTVQDELPLLKKYLELPQVHVALDPEFAMHDGMAPETVIGTLDATDINYAANYLAQIVQQYHLPPKVLIIHRFTEHMLTHAEEIKPLPEVQIVVDMDGFGAPGKKEGTYDSVVITEPIQFTGFKLFYINDVQAGHMMNPSEVLKLSPQPSFIQYQ